MAKKVFILFSAALFGFGCSQITPSRSLPNQTACTMEARMCPDGSYVGRSGPNCEFTVCPSVPLASSTVITTSFASLNAPAIIPGMTITPLEVLEDSRCAVDVQCIWAGTLRLRAHIANVGTAEDVTLVLGTPYDFGGMHITLSEATPAPNSKKTIQPSEYRFKFTITE